jgi:hypothetical protein
MFDLTGSFSYLLAYEYNETDKTVPVIQLRLIEIISPKEKVILYINYKKIYKNDKKF